MIAAVKEVMSLQSTLELMQEGMTAWSVAKATLLTYLPWSTRAH